MLSYFTEAEPGNNNDANWTDPRYDELYIEQKQELDPESRVELVHEMLTIFHEAAVYFPLYLARTSGLQDRYLRGLRAAAGEVGPVMFQQTSPSYVLLRPVGARPEG